MAPLPAERSESLVKDFLIYTGILVEKQAKSVVLDYGNPALDFVCLQKTYFVVIHEKTPFIYAAFTENRLDEVVLA
jgi:hypothetical protein